jgi:hypothetical protein
MGRAALWAALEMRRLDGNSPDYGILTDPAADPSESLYHSAAIDSITYHC